MIPGSRMQLWTFLADRTYQRDIKPVPTLSCGGVFRYRSGERLHGMQEVTGSIPVFSTRSERHHTLCGAFFVVAKRVRAWLTQESAVHGLQEGHRNQNRPGILHQKSTVLRRKYGDFFYTDAEKGGSFPQKGKPPPLLIIG